ncbi:PREDICTED: putative HERV-K_Xq28 provirus ancestral Pol protein [Chlamydotis macqueenii]|uniref:putative HERV-K_Xq28 provirus ancestral Pol protein n=1 Tax=Chlamydotis macqueenii TaxID=187382 RepID=UPI000529D476|nr:PREDICTED: putative HERV-K_Xq28 provirus ancestral Pol protein [Chlamydotis macqueenii]
MGPLQPGLPIPSMLPRDWQLLIVDLKDCLFTIPLHPNDCPRFALTVPSLNNSESARRYHWTVLPQGMNNSPTICQWYVAAALQPFRQEHPEYLGYLYMNDILVPGCPLGPRVALKLASQLSHVGLQIAPEKVQHTAPFKHLGSVISNRSVAPRD